MADQDTRQEISPSQLVDHFTQQVSNPDPKYDNQRVAFYRIQGYAQGRQLDDSEFARQLVTQFPSLGKQYRISGLDQMAGDQTPPAGTPKPGAPPAPPEGSSSLWNAVRRGAIKGVASMADFAADANDVINKVDPSAWLTRAVLPHAAEGQQAASDAARGFARWERGRAESMPKPTGIPATVAAAVPEVIGQLAPYAVMPEVAVPEVAGTSTAYKIANAARAAIPNALKMGAVEAVRAVQGGPIAMAKAGAEGAAIGGVGFPAAEATVGKLPIVNRLPTAAQRFTSVAVPAGGIAAAAGASPEDATAQGIAYGLLASPGGKAKEKPTAAPPEPPANSPVSPATAAAAPATPEAKLSRGAQSVVDLAKQELGRNAKYRITTKGIANDLGIKNEKAGPIYAELRKAGMVDAQGNLLGGAKPTGAPPAAPVAPAAAPAPAEAAPAVTPEKQAEAEAAFGGPAATPSTEDQISANDKRIAEIQQILLAQGNAQAAKPTGSAPAAPAAPKPAEPEAPATPPAQPAAAPAEVIQPANAGAGGHEALESAALARLKAKFAAFAKEDTGSQYNWNRPEGEGVSLSSQDFQDLYTIGRGIVRRVGNNFEAWRGEMVSKLGGWIDHHLMPIWQTVHSATQTPPTGPGQASAGSPPPGAAPEGVSLPAPPPTFQLKEGGPQIPITPDMMDRFRQPSVPPRTMPPPEPSMKFSSPSGADESVLKPFPATEEGLRDYIRQELARGKSNEEILQEASRWQAASQAEVNRLKNAPSAPPIARAPVAPQVWEPTPGPQAIQTPPGAVAAPPPEPPPGITEAQVVNNPQLADQLRAHGMVPMPEEAVNALKDSGFAERQNVFQGAWPNQSLNPKVLRPLPSGQQASEVWTRPVADGAIEVQRHGTTGEWTATKHYSTGASHTINGTGDASLMDYLKNVQAREIPLQLSQKAGPTQVGGTGTVHSAPAAAPEVGDRVADAVRQVKDAIGALHTPEELEHVLSAISDRTKQQRLAANDRRIAEIEALQKGEEPSTKPAPPVERNAQAMSMLDIGRVRDIIAQSVKGMKPQAEAAAAKGPQGTTFPQPTPAAPFGAAIKVAGVGKYEPTGVADNGDITYRFTSERTGATVDHQMPGIEWRRLHAQGEPVSQPQPEISKGIEAQMQQDAGAVTGKNRRTKASTQQFGVTQMSDGAWQVIGEDGGETNIHIGKDTPSSKFYNVYVGSNFKRKTASLTAAKIEAIKLAEQHLAGGGEGVPRRVGRPAGGSTPQVEMQQ